MSSLFCSPVISLVKFFTKENFPSGDHKSISYLILTPPGLIWFLKKTSTAVQHKQRARGRGFSSYRRASSAFTSKGVVWWGLQMAEFILSVTLQSIPKDIPQSSLLFHYFYVFSLYLSISVFVFLRTDGEFVSDHCIVPVWSWWAVTCTAVISYFTYLLFWGQSSLFSFHLCIPEALIHIASLHQRNVWKSEKKKWQRGSCSAHL